MPETKNEDIKAEVKKKTPAENQGPEETREAAAVKRVKRYMLWSVGAGLIPIPVVDIAALAGVQLKMLHRLAGDYGSPFSQSRGKSIIAALTGTLTAGTLTGSAFTRCLKAIPGFGLVGMVSMPIYSGATTYAIGKVFIQHFESGGTFLDFDPQKVRNYFAKLYEEGKLATSELKAKQA